jgi:hypothetical protein
MPVSDTKDDGIIRFVFSNACAYKVLHYSFIFLMYRLVVSLYSELLKDFQTTSGVKPQQIIIFRSVYK